MRFSRSLVAAASIAFAGFLVGADAVAAEGAPTAPAVPAPAGRGALPWIGVSMDNGGDTGVRVEQVVRGSPAERAGLRAGDRIVMIDGVRVTAPGHVTRGVSARKVGETIALQLDRAGGAVQASIVLASRPSSDDLLRMHLVGSPAPAWSHVTPVGNAPASLAALRGKVALIDFWASWCGPCRMIAPRLSALKNRLGPQGLAVVGITTDDAEQAAVFAERHHMSYPVVADTAGETSRAYNITGLPTMILVDKNGVVRDVFVGFDPSAEPKLEASIRKLLAEPGVPPPVPPVPPPAVARPDGR